MLGVMFTFEAPGLNPSGPTSTETYTEVSGTFNTKENIQLQNQTYVQVELIEKYVRHMETFH